MTSKFASLFFNIFVFPLTSLVSTPSFMSVLIRILELRQILFIRDLTRNPEIENTPVLETGASYGYHVSTEKFVKVNAVDFYVIVTSFRVTESYCYFEAVLFDFQQEPQAGYPFLDLGKVRVFN